MTDDYPRLLASNREFFWTLRPDLSFDYFSFQEEGAGSLLLIGMHLSDAMPWLCARNPLYFARAPGLVDLESKRILGKRFRTDTDLVDPSLPFRTLDTLALVLHIVKETGHSFQSDSGIPTLPKIPGKLLPRQLKAKVQVTTEGREWTLHARNFSEVSQCLHAELTLVMGLSQLFSGLPQPPEKLDTFQLETTLKPCRMCAAFLHVVRKKCRAFSVSYEEDDPGRLAAHTLLDRFGYQSQN
jgi:hypothetical protein